MSSLTTHHLKERLSYDPITGVFVWKKARCDRIGKTAGALNGFGHRQIRLGGVLYMAHRLAWLYVYGEWPETDIDHINGMPDDNRINNLRLATHKQNQENVKLRLDNSSGCRGVHWDIKSKKWYARVQHHKVRMVLGSFDDLDKATAAAKTARDLLFTHNKTGYAA